VRSEVHPSVGLESYDEEVKKLIDKLAEELLQKRDAGENPCCRVLNRNFSEVSNARELNDLISQCKIVFINFYSTYCPHCMMFDRVFRSIGAKYSNTALFIRVNVMMNPDIAMAYYVMGVPTTVAVVDGTEADRVIGLVPPSEFEVFVRKIIDSNPCEGWST